MDEFKKVAPNAGSYVAESSFFERGWQKSYWGPNYARLRAIRMKYDHSGLFFVHHGVGSEVERRRLYAFSVSGSPLFCTVSSAPRAAMWVSFSFLSAVSVKWKGYWITLVCKSLFPFRS
jgi:hypothetical protein